MTNLAPCPKCSATNSRQLKFTWWGGAIGPRILKHVKCETCGTKYNGNTGKDNTTGIVIYSVVVGLIAFVLVFGFVVLLAVLSIATR